MGYNKCFNIWADFQSTICNLLILEPKQQKLSEYSEKQLHQFINIIGKCRNVCAHGERLFSFRINETIPDTLLHKKLQITQNNNHYVYGKQDLFAVVIALRYLINNDEFRLFKTALSKLIKTVIKQCPHLTEKQLLDNMGFPANWDKISDTGKYNLILS